MTTSEGRFYSNGMDLDWIQYIQESDPIGWMKRVDLTKLALRILTFPLPTIALINGEFTMKILTLQLPATGQYSCITALYKCIYIMVQSHKSYKKKQVNKNEMKCRFLRELFLCQKLLQI